MNIIDLLRKGNQELFHSSMIAWMLDPQGSGHNHGRAFINRFAERIASDDSTLQDLLASAHNEPRVLLELATRKARYDVAIEFDGAGAGTKKLVIVENKTKSIGAESQTDSYREQGNVESVICLGLSQLSFSPGVRKKLPFLDYSDVLEIIKSLPRGVADDNCQVLLDDYRDFLERELGRLEAVKQMGASDDEKDVAVANKVLRSALPHLNENDVRFLNLSFLQEFIWSLREPPLSLAGKWNSSKNQASGAWIAKSNDDQSSYRWADGLKEHVDRGASFWMHIELWKGVVAGSDNEVGCIQLRCAGVEDRVSLLSRFREMSETGALNVASPEARDVQIRKTAISPKCDSFYIARLLLRRADLNHKRLADLASAFFNLFLSSPP
jgi:hypothetical protein